MLKKEEYIATVLKGQPAYFLRKYIYSLNITPGWKTKKSFLEKRTKGQLVFGEMQVRVACLCNKTDKYDEFYRRSSAIFLTCDESPRRCIESLI